MNGSATAKKSAIDTQGRDGWQHLRGDENLVYLAERAQSYSEQLNARLDALKQALDDGDADTWAEVARSLTDTTARLGAIRMMKLCIALQMQGRRSLLVKARETYDELCGEYDRFKQTLIPFE